MLDGWAMDRMDDLNGVVVIVRWVVSFVEHVCGTVVDNEMMIYLLLSSVMMCITTA